MPELPEVETVVNELNRKLKNRKIKSVKVNAPKIIGVGPATLPPARRVESKKALKFIKLLQGLAIIGVKRRAKLIIINLSRPSSTLPLLPLHQDFGGQAGEGKEVKTLFSLLVHLKMTGQFIFEDQAQRRKTGGAYRLLNKKTAPLIKLPSKHTHVIFKFFDRSTLYFNDVRKFGYLKLVHNDEINQVKELNDYGPEPLDVKFTPGHFVTAAQKCPKRKIKQVLMDNKIVVGIGNIYSDEILFHSGVRPTRIVKSLSQKELSTVYKWIKPVLINGIKAKGSSVGDFVRTDGSWGQMGKFHFVYGRRGQKCKKCGTIIESIKLGGRTGSFCPKCQK